MTSGSKLVDMGFFNMPKELTEEQLIASHHGAYLAFSLAAYIISLYFKEEDARNKIIEEIDIESRKFDSNVAYFQRERPYAFTGIELDFEEAQKEYEHTLKTLRARME